MSKVVWLASYPKSGNTWIRTFLWALQNKGPINLNRLYTGGIFSAKNIIETILDVNPDTLYPHEIEEYQRIAYNYHFSNAKETKFLKIHDAYTYSKWDGKPLIPLQPEHIVLYIVRNPIDVTPSFANHSSNDSETTINKQINNSNGGLVKNANWGNQFPQPMGNWSMHVESWLGQSVAPVHLVRYEDMKNHPFETFKEIVDKMGLIHTDDDIKIAIERTSFDKIKALELERGFREKANPDSSFFFHGKIGRGAEVLTPDQISRIRKVHAKVMKQLKYW